MPASSTALLTLLLTACGGAKPVASAASAPANLLLPPTPTTVARLELAAGERHYAGPARIDVRSATAPVHLMVEDFELAEPIEVLVDPGPPARFTPVAGNTWVDEGSYVNSGDRMVFTFTRTPTVGTPARIVVLANLKPTPQAPPRDWLRPGTTLYYGLSYDDKPITAHVPMGLRVTVQAADAGAWALDWVADLDPATQKSISGALFERGVLRIPAAVAEKAATHDDRLVVGDVETSSTSVFLPRSARRNLTAYGAAAWEDLAVGPAGLIQRVDQRSVVVQADDTIWAIPATVAVAAGGEAVYVVADDADAPLLLSARRPGWSMRLMAIGRANQP